MASTLQLSSSVHPPTGKMGEGGEGGVGVFVREDRAPGDTAPAWAKGGTAAAAARAAAAASAASASTSASAAASASAAIESANSLSA